MYFRNLLEALKQLLKQRKTLRSILLNITRLGNALTGGDYNKTTSARIGYHSIKGGKYWNALRWMVDQSFYPLEGPQHCFRAFEWEGYTSYRRSSDIALAALSVVVFAACLVIAPCAWLYATITGAQKKQA